jgi:hypothetical protein
MNDCNNLSNNQIPGNIWTKIRSSHLDFPPQNQKNIAFNLPPCGGEFLMMMMMQGDDDLALKFIKKKKKKIPIPFWKSHHTLSQHFLDRIFFLKEVG